MGIFAREPEYDRSRILDAAARARAAKRYRKAVALYRRVLAVEPRNVELHARLAPLLAVTGNAFDAWESFRYCAEAALAEKRVEQAAAIYREAARCLPRELAAWLGYAAAERRRGKEREALTALLEARRHFRGRRIRPQRIALLRQALEIDPSSVAVALDLARQLARSDQQSEAQLVLERIVQQAVGSDLRRVRGAQWRLAPTLSNTWRWLRPGAGSARPAAARSRRMHA